eukprot:scaffold24594_cov62-Phaeocystis_antarctica.AAC.1
MARPMRGRFNGGAWELRGAPVGALGSVGFAPVRNRSLVIGAGDRGYVLLNAVQVVVGDTDALLICGI